MSYEIEEQIIEPIPVLFIRRQVPTEQLAATFAEVLPAVFGYVMQSGADLAGAPFARYLDMAETTTVEAGCPVSGAAEASGEIELGEIPGGTVAMTIHRGPYEALGDAHAALQAWLLERGYAQGGPPWESYVTDPGEVSDPSELQTIVYLPLSAS